jgi:carbon-monoxide dehydrogenase large subunit
MRDIAFVRSPVAHGDLKSIAIAQGLEYDAVWTAERLKDRVRPIRAALNRPGFRVADQPVLASGRVRYVGEMIAAVVADNRAVAEDLLSSVQSDIDSRDAVLDPEQALRPDAPLLHEEWPSNAYSSSTRTIGDFEGAVARAEVVVTRDLRMARVMPLPMETRGCVASYDHGTRILTIYLSTQRPHLIRTMLAEQLVGIDESQIRVIAPDVGGGFGGKSNLYPEEIALAAVAREVPYPVRWIEDRYEHFLAASHSRQHVQKLTSYSTKAGELLAVEARFLVDGGAYSMRTSTAAIEAGMAASVLPGPYRLRNYRFEAISVATNKTMVGPYRGVGRPAAVFAMERIIHETAVALGMEPHEFRARNMIDAADHPYVSATGLHYDSGDYKGLLNDAVTAIGVPAVREEQSRMPKTARRAIGVGFGCYTEQTAHGAAEWYSRGSPFEYGFESARIRIDPSGAVTVSVGIQSHGQGLETTLAQVAGDELGIPYDQIKVRHGDTELCPYGMGTVASRSMVMAGGAVHGAAVRLAEKIRRIAAANLGCEPGDVRLADGSVTGNGTSFTIEKVARIAYLELHALPKDIEPGLEVLFNYRPSVETGAFSAGVHAAKVAVDLDSGAVELLDFVVAEDCGKVVNPLIVDGQILGGAAQGIGQALYEEIRYADDGQPLTVTLANYLIPGAVEVPAVRILHRETLSPFTVFGMKGLGEGGAIAPPAAIANAVSDALKPFGVDVREVPIRPADIWNALQRTQSNGSMS